MPKASTDAYSEWWCPHGLLQQPCAPEPHISKRFFDGHSNSPVFTREPPAWGLPQTPTDSYRLLHETLQGSETLADLIERNFPNSFGNNGRSVIATDPARSTLRPWTVQWIVSINISTLRMAVHYGSLFTVDGCTLWMTVHGDCPRHWWQFTKRHAEKFRWKLLFTRSANGKCSIFWPLISFNPVMWDSHVSRLRSLFCW